MKLHNLAGSIRVKVKDIPEDATLLLRARGLAGKAEFIPEEGKIKPLAYNELDADNMVPYKDVAVTGIPAGAEFIDVPVFIGNPNADGKEKRPLAIYLNGKKLTGSVPSVTTKVGAVSSSEVPEMIWNATTQSLTRISTLDEDSEPEEVEENTDPAKDYDYLITSAEELLWFAENAGSLAGKVVKLGASIDLNNQPWTPISGFKGTFDGAEFTISNLNVAVTGKASAGLFADARATIKNLYLKDVTISGNNKAGAIVGDGLCAKIENCHVIGGTITSTPYNNDDANHVGGIVGYLSSEPGTTATEPAAWVKDCTVTGLNITAYRDVAGIVGTTTGYHKTNPELAKAIVTGNTISNTTIIADQTVDYVEAKAANAGEIVGRNLKNVELTGNTVGENVVVKVKSSSTSEGLANAVKTAGAEIVVEAGEYTFPSSSIAEGVTIICEEGTTFTGTSGLSINGATVVGATFSNPSGNVTNSTGVNGTFKNCTFEGKNALRYCYAGKTAVFENCEFNATSVYAIHYDGTAGADIMYKNCKITGWVAIAGGHNSLVFDGCEIYGNGTYGLIRTYGDTTIKNCTFDVKNVNSTDVYQDGIHAVDCKITVQNCVNVNGNIEDIFNVSGTGEIVVE